MPRRSAGRVTIVVTVVLSVGLTLVLLLPRLSRSWLDGELVLGPRAEKPSTAELHAIAEDPARQGGRMLIWQGRARDDVPALALWARPTDAQLTWLDLASSKVKPAIDDTEDYWTFQIHLGENSTSGDQRPVTCPQGRLPFSDCTLTSAIVQVSRARTAFDVFDALSKAEADGADVKPTRRSPPRLQRFWSEGPLQQAVFKGWDCEESDWAQDCYRASMIQQWAPALFGTRPHAAFVDDQGGGYFMFHGRLVHVRRTVGAASLDALVPATWNALIRQAREVFSTPDIEEEIATAQVDASSCVQLTTELLRWKTTHYVFEKAYQEWGRRSAPCIRAAQVGIRAQDLRPQETVTLLTSLSEALWGVEDRVPIYHYPIYEALIAALAEKNDASSALVIAASRYYDSVGQGDTTDARRRADELLTTVRALALSPPRGTDEQALLRLRYAVLGYYSVRQQSRQQIEFLREWLSREQAAYGGGGGSHALLEPLRILVQTLAFDAEAEEVRSALNQLQMVWLQQPIACASGAEAAKREAEIGFTLLRTYHVYALRTGQGKLVAPMLTNIVERLQACYGRSHSLAVQASAIQQDVAAGRPPRAI